MTIRRMPLKQTQAAKAIRSNTNVDPASGTVDVVFSSAIPVGRIELVDAKSIWFDRPSSEMLASIGTKLVAGVVLTPKAVWLGAKAPETTVRRTSVG